MNGSSSPSACDRAYSRRISTRAWKDVRRSHLAVQRAIDGLDDARLACASGELVAVAGFTGQHGLLNGRRLNLG